MVCLAHLGYCHGRSKSECGEPELSESEVVKLDGFERLFAKGTPIELEQAQVQQVETLRIFFNNLDRLNRNATLYHFEHSSVEGLKKRLAEDIEVIFVAL